MWYSGGSIKNAHSASSLKFRSVSIHATCVHLIICFFISTHMTDSVLSGVDWPILRAWEWIYPIEASVLTWLAVGCLECNKQVLVGRMNSATTDTQMRTAINTPVSGAEDPSSWNQSMWVSFMTARLDKILSSITLSGKPYTAAAKTGGECETIKLMCYIMGYSWNGNDFNKPNSCEHSKNFSVNGDNNYKIM